LLEIFYKMDDYISLREKYISGLSTRLHLNIFIAAVDRVPLNSYTE